MIRPMLPEKKSIPPRVLHVASVSFLNAKPLIYGLEGQPDIQLLLDVPSRLLEALRTRQADVALLPVIDYQRQPGLRIVPAAGIGSDGPTLTVRIFSRCPIEQIRTLACDSDSHTSVALAKIVLAELYGLHPEFVELPDVTDRIESMLLIGDKVISAAPKDYPHQLDLGEAWKRLTGLPFVFAVWMARADVPLGDLPERLAQARREGMAHIEEIIAEHAPARHWPLDVAQRYLTQHLQFAIGNRQIEAMGQFYALAAKHGIIATVRPLEGLSQDCLSI